MGIDLDQWAERAAIMEYDGGMKRFAAETAAARAQGYERHEVADAIRERHSQQQRNQRPADARNATDNLPGVQPRTAEEARPVLERHVHDGRGGVEVLALSERGRGVLR